MALILDLIFNSLMFVLLEPGLFHCLCAALISISLLMLVFRKEIGIV